MVTEQNANLAAAHLYAALIVALPSDEPVIIENIRSALRLLDPKLLARAEQVRAQVRSEQVPR